MLYVPLLCLCSMLCLMITQNVKFIIKSDFKDNIDTVAPFFEKWEDAVKYDVNAWHALSLSRN